MTSTFPPTLSYISFVIGVTSFLITCLNLAALYANFIATVRSAPNEIRDALGNLRQQLLEEREALRQQTRELRAKKAQHRASISQQSQPYARRHNANSRRSNGRRDNHHYPLTFCEQTLSLHYQTIRDLWQQFKTLERPFLVQGPRAEAIRNGAIWGEGDLINEKGLREDFERYGEVGMMNDYSELYRCDFLHRFIWWQSKDGVVRLSNMLQKVMLRRMEREVSSCRMMLKQLRDGGHGPEEVASPGFGGGGGDGGRYQQNRQTRRRSRRGKPSAPVYEYEYETTDGSEASTSDDIKHQAGERRTSVRVSESRPRHSRTRTASPGGDGEAPKHTGEGWRQRPESFSRVVEVPARGPAPVVVELRRSSHPGSQAAYDGLPSSYRDPRR